LRWLLCLHRVIVGYLCPRVSPPRYSWCSRRLIEERFSWSSQLSLADLIPLETTANTVRPPGGQWKDRLVVGHNVSYDRALVKDQYLLKVSVLLKGHRRQALAL